MSLTMQKLRQDHVNLGRLLDILEQELDSLHEGTRTDYELMQDAMLYMTRYPDEVHHPTEDVVFRRLMDRHPATRPAVAGLLDEHEKLVERGRAFRAVLMQVVDGSLVSRAELEREGRDYVRMLRRHVQREETELFPLADQHMQPEDWQAVEAEIELREDPLFGPVTGDDFRDLLAHISRQSA